MKEAKIISRILLGLLMLIPGLTKLFVTGADKVSGMVSGIALFAWAPLFWAWVLIIAEVLCGLAILANFKTKYTAIPPIFIMLVIVLFMQIKWAALASTSWSGVLFHLIAATGYLNLMSEK